MKWDKEENYEPPGRLRDFDMIVFDECSQIDSDVWNDVEVAGGQLPTATIFGFVGDFQQLQQVCWQRGLEERMRNQVRGGKMKHVELRQHDQARTPRPRITQLTAQLQTQPTRSGLPGNILCGPMLAERLSCSDSKPSTAEMGIPGNPGSHA